MLAPFTRQRGAPWSATPSHLFEPLGRRLLLVKVFGEAEPLQYLVVTTNMRWRCLVELGPQCADQCALVEVQLTKRNREPEDAIESLGSALLSTIGPAVYAPQLLLLDVLRDSHLNICARPYVNDFVSSDQEVDPGEPHTSATDVYLAAAHREHLNDIHGQKVVGGYDVFRTLLAPTVNIGRDIKPANVIAFRIAVAPTSKPNRAERRRTAARWIPDGYLAEKLRTEAGGGDLFAGLENQRAINLSGGVETHWDPAVPIELGVRRLRAEQPLRGAA